MLSIGVVYFAIFSPFSLLADEARSTQSNGSFLVLDTLYFFAKTTNLSANLLIYRQISLIFCSPKYFEILVMEKNRLICR